VWLKSTLVSLALMLLVFLLRFVPGVSVSVGPLGPALAAWAVFVIFCVLFFITATILSAVEFVRRRLRRRSNPSQTSA
jgi:hypothetical protein